MSESQRLVITRANERPGVRMIHTIKYLVQRKVQGHMLKANSS